MTPATTTTTTRIAIADPSPDRTVLDACTHARQLLPRQPGRGAQYDSAYAQALLNYFAQRDTEIAALPGRLGNLLRHSAPVQDWLED